MTTTDITRKQEELLLSFSQRRRLGITEITDQYTIDYLIIQIMASGSQKESEFLLLAFSPSQLLGKLHASQPGWISDSLYRFWEKTLRDLTALPPQE
jgi:hypothetical protein